MHRSIVCQIPKQKNKDPPIRRYIRAVNAMPIIVQTTHPNLVQHEKPKKATSLYIIVSLASHARHQAKKQTTYINAFTSLAHSPLHPLFTSLITTITNDKSPLRSHQPSTHPPGLRFPSRHSHAHPSLLAAPHPSPPPPRYHPRTRFPRARGRCSGVYAPRHR